MMENISLDEGIRELIYTRTGYLFLGKKNGVSNIIPKNLRGNINLISLLTAMPVIKYSLREKVFKVLKSLGLEEKIGRDILKKLTEDKERLTPEEKTFLYQIELIDEEDFNVETLKKTIMVFPGVDQVNDFESKFNTEKVELFGLKIKDEDGEKSLQNRKIFKNFFFKSWISEILTISQKNVIEELFERDVVEKNKYIISYLIKKYKLIDRVKENMEKNADEKKGPWEDIRNRKLEEILRISSEENEAFNISLGDVLYILDKIKLYENTKEFEMFSFAIKTIYSILLYDFHKEEKDLNWDSKYIELIGGSLLNPYHKDIMKYSIAKEKRHNFDINYQYLKKIVEGVDEKFKDLGLSLLRMIKNTHSTESREKYRQTDEKYYKYNPAPNLKEANFDVFQFFINIELKKEVFEHSKKDFNSKIYIGNIEVLELVISSLVKLKKSGNNYGIVFKGYVENLKKIEILNNIKYIRLEKNEYIHDLSKEIDELSDPEMEEFFKLLIVQKNELQKKIDFKEIVKRYDGIKRGNNSKKDKILPKLKEISDIAVELEIDIDIQEQLNTYKNKYKEDYKTTPTGENRKNLSGKVIEDCKGILKAKIDEIRAVSNG